MKFCSVQALPLSSQLSRYRETMALQAQHCSFSDHRTAKPIGRKPRDCVRVAVAALRVEDLAEIVHNKVVIAAAASAAIGQVVKPFAAALFYSKPFDFKTALLAGGFPSTHSSAVVAVATSIGLERGFSDSIFGLTLVYATLIMYDAQGVRREVGVHAKTLNSIINPEMPTTVMPFKGSSNELIELSSFASEADKESRRTTRVSMSSLGTDTSEEVTERVSSSTQLKESIGHTEVEVIAGGFLGFFVSLAVNMIM